MVQAHRWVIDVDKVVQLREYSDAVQRKVYLCGAGSGDKAVWHHFTKVFALIIDANTLKHRLAHRTTNDFGKTSEELREVLEWHKGYEERHRQRESVLIDATQSARAVVDQILAQS